MAVPLVTNINPASGHTSGLNLVRFLGFGFQTPPVTSVAGALQQTVRVTVDGRAATLVQVVNSSLLYAIMPYGVEGSADVVVENIDSAGDLIPGETVTLADAYTYAEAKLTTVSGLNALTRALIERMRAQIIPEVVPGQHTDYDATPDGLDLTQLATLPSIALLGPQLRENRFYSLNGSRVIGEATRRSPYTVDVSFELIGVSDKLSQAINLQHLTTAFFDLNRYLSVDVNPEDPGAGQVEFEMDWESGAQPTIVNLPGESNLRSFSGRALIRGFDISCIPGFEPPVSGGRTATVTDVVLQGTDNC